MTDREKLEGWTNSELADALLEYDDFCDDHVAHGEEGNVWQWDRCDLLDYAEDYEVLYMNY